ncbi:MAG: Holliday junction resolvase RuvX [Rhodospirillaceae bacterium TMED167]|nr:Holliday junction resolvase RuvX [Rhodospirillaceae bacterium]MDG2032664.1 Holliday junction resolvase RuvX [Rhodospirillales bacterium]OUW27898.1 MAG: Holliday junction resolvase RuvX [Rhodospirillaceae bacterium TMED167]
MIHDTLAKMMDALPPNARLLGLDVGSKTIGIAVSDSARKVASSIDTIRRTKFSKDVVILQQAATERHAAGLILGLPVSMDGTEGPACQSVRQFAANVDGAFNTQISFWDERLSTSAVERFLVKEADMSRNRRAQVVDKMAATYILQGALDFLA